jgi:WD40 repeat protein
VDEPNHLEAASLDVALARRIDAVCRRFEADWRGGQRPRVDDYLASANQDRTVTVWDLSTGQDSRTLHGHSAEVRALAYSHDGRRIVSASLDDTVQLWDLATEQEVLTLRGPTNGIFSVAFSPDGRRIAAGSGDGAVKVWDASPMTQELRAIREARGLLDFLSAQQRPAAEIRDRIRRDPTISDDVRRRALDLAEHPPAGAPSSE